MGAFPQTATDGYGSHDVGPAALGTDHDSTTLVLIDNLHYGITFQTYKWDNNHRANAAVSSNITPVRYSIIATALQAVVQPPGETNSGKQRQKHQHPVLLRSGRSK